MDKKQAEASLVAKQVTLRDKLCNLTPLEKEAVTNYFNLYNAAAWHYNEVLSDAAKEYVDESVQYARELNELEKMHDAVEPEHEQEMVDRFNLAQEAIEEANEHIHLKESNA